ncbi:MAG: ADP-ribosylglycohydrolase family protein [Arenicella sp.]|nr:ADP-ribosylglycohydrolase family protein [Arenicella sp.]
MNKKKTCIRQSLYASLKILALLLVVSTAGICGQLMSVKPSTSEEVNYSEYISSDTDLIFSRSEYAAKLHGFWLGQSIANWTGLVTEMDRVEAPFYTDEDWGKVDEPAIWGLFTPHASRIDYYLLPPKKVWGADDDTDIEYMYQHLLESHETSRLSAHQIREGWLKHIYSNEDGPISPKEFQRENYLWVSNETAYYLMKDQQMLPPATSEPANNPNYNMIDAQLTTEIFGLFSPGRPDIALELAHLPIRVTAKNEAEWIARFYVSMHSLAASVDKQLPINVQLMEMSKQARGQLPDNSYPADMYDFVLASYSQNPDKDDWEKTRDAIYQAYQVEGRAGYKYKQPFDAGINFAASLVSLFYGQGDLLRTIKIGTLAGWDSDNPTATWGGLLGFMLGKDAVQAAFSDKPLSELYWISRTRRGFPDLTPDLIGEDTFSMMAQRGLLIIDRVVTEEMTGGVDLDRDMWMIPPAKQ